MLAILVFSFFFSVNPSGSNSTPTSSFRTAPYFSLPPIGLTVDVVVTTSAWLTESELSELKSSLTLDSVVEKALVDVLTTVMVGEASAVVDGDEDSSKAVDCISLSVDATVEVAVKVWVSNATTLTSSVDKTSCSSSSCERWTSSGSGDRVLALRTLESVVGGTSRWSCLPEIIIHININIHT